MGREEVAFSLGEFDAGANVGGDLWSITGFGQEDPLEAGESLVDAGERCAKVGVGGGGAQGAEAREGGVEGCGVGVMVLDGVLDEVGDEHGRVEAAEGEAEPREDLGEVPLGERGEV